MAITRAGGGIGIPGLYVTEDPGGRRTRAKSGQSEHSLRARLGEVAHVFHRADAGDEVQPRVDDGDPPRRIQIAKAVNVTLISLDEAPKGYKDFDKGAASKFVIDPHGSVKKAA